MTALCRRPARGPFRSLGWRAPRGRAAAPSRPRTGAAPRGPGRPGGAPPRPPWAGAGQPLRLGAGRRASRPPSLGRPAVTRPRPGRLPPRPRPAPGVRCPVRHADRSAADRASSGPRPDRSPPLWIATAHPGRTAGSWRWGCRAGDPTAATAPRAPPRRGRPTGRRPPAAGSCAPAVGAPWSTPARERAGSGTRGSAGEWSRHHPPRRSRRRTYVTSTTGSPQPRSSRGSSGPLAGGVWGSRTSAATPPPGAAGLTTSPAA